MSTAAPHHLTEIATQWRMARRLFALYGPLQQRFNLGVPTCPELESPINKAEPEVIERVWQWFDQMDALIQVHQLRQLLQTSPLGTEENLRAIITRYFEHEEKTDSHRDKLDFLLVQYLGSCAPPGFYDKDVTFDDCAQALEPVLGEVGMHPPRWTEPLDKALGELEKCESLRDLLSQGILEEVRQMKIAAGDMYFGPTALVAITRFNFLARRSFVRMIAADLHAIRSTLRELEIHGVKTVDCSKAELSSTESVPHLRELCHDWKKAFHAAYAAGQSFRQLVDVRTAVEDALTSAIAEKQRREMEEKEALEALERAQAEAAERERIEEEEQQRKAEEAERERQAVEAAARQAEEERQRKEDEERARAEAEAKARQEAEEQARREAEEKARMEAEEKARQEAEERRRQEEEDARLKAEEDAAHAEYERVLRASEEQAQREAEEKARQEEARKAAEEQAQREAAEKALKAEEQRQRLEAEKKSKEEEDLAHLEALYKAEEEAAAKARVEEEARQQQEEARANMDPAELAALEEYERAVQQAEEKERQKKEQEKTVAAAATAKAETAAAVTTPPPVPKKGDSVQDWHVAIAEHLKAANVKPGTVANLLVGHVQLVLSTWEVTAFGNDKSDDAKSLQNAVAGRAMLVDAIDRKKVTGDSSTLRSALWQSQAILANIQARMKIARESNDIDNAVNLAATSKRLHLLIEQGNKLKN